MGNSTLFHEVVSSYSFFIFICNLAADNAADLVLPAACSLVGL